MKGTLHRRIIKINAELCDGCGLCVDACHEGAIGLERGRAVLLRDDYCDGLGDCLPACPTGAITFEMRNALPYDEEAVQRLQEKQSREKKKLENKPFPPHLSSLQAKSPERAWPIKIQLVNEEAAYLKQADLLIAADCTAFVHPNFYESYAKNKVVLTACPKLEAYQHAAKLESIFQKNAIRSITLIRMSVPCCEALARSAMIALAQCACDIPFRCIRLTTEGIEAIGL